MATRERSPNYPTHSLESSIGFAKLVYGKEKMSPAAPEVVAQAIGHEGLTGPSRGKIAALRQYALMEPTGDNLRLTDLAFRILHAPEEMERAEAIAQAALKPPLFSEIFAEKPDASDESLKYYLRREKKFSDDGASRAVKAYRETAAFANLNELGYNIENQPEPEDGGKTQTPRSGEKEKSFAGQPKPQAPKMEQNAVAYTWPLPDGIDAQVIFSGSKPTRRAVQRLVDYLKFFQEDLGPTESTAPKSGWDAVDDDEEPG